MRAPAFLQTRVERLVYGPRDPKAGAVDSLYEIARDARLNHRIAVTEGILSTELSEMLKGFFAELRRTRRLDREVD